MGGALDLRRSIEEATAAKGAGLPRSAAEELERAAASFSGRPIKAAPTPKLDPFAVRRALAKAAREARDRTPAAVYAPGSAERLLIVRAADLAGLLEGVRRSTTNEKEGA